MNDKQKIVILLGVAVLFCSGLYPHWNVECKKSIVGKADISFAPFYSPDVIPVQPRPLRQLLLAEFKFVPTLANSRSELLKLLRWFHASNMETALRWIYTLYV